MNFLKNLLYEDRIIIISKNRVVEKKNGIFRKIITSISLCWVLFTTLFFLNNKFFTTNINTKKTQGTDIGVVDENLEKKIIATNDMLHNIVKYLSGINYYDKFVDLNEDKDANTNEKYLSFQEKNTNENYLKFIYLIRNMNNGLNTLDNLVSSRINGINNIISRSETIKKKIDNLYEVAYNANTKEIESNIEVFNNKSNLLKDISYLSDKINYLSFLEKTLIKMPIVKPMNQYFLTSKFGIRRDPFTRERKMHKGIDIVGITDSKVRATADGVVERSGIGTKIGNVVVVNHGNNIKTYYGHLNNNLVQVGDKVKRGDVVGTQGNTGRSTGPHLHYQIDIDDQSIDPINFIEIGDNFF